MYIGRFVAHDSIVFFGFMRIRLSTAFTGRQIAALRSALGQCHGVEEMSNDERRVAWNLQLTAELLLAHVFGL